MQIVAFYTVNTPYEQEAEIFQQNLEAYGVAPLMYPVQARKDWVENCALKSHIIKLALNDTTDNILYLDIDARIKRKPPFEEIEKDIPGFILTNKNRPLYRQLQSGTIYWPNNERSKFLVEDWIEAQAEDPNEWDQKTLGRVFSRYPYFELPLEWAKIAGKPDTQHIEDPIIFHTQASRRLRRQVNRRSS